jgi:hypothetical protein
VDTITLHYIPEDIILLYIQYLTKEIKEYQRKEEKICAKVLLFYDDTNIRTIYHS